MKKLPKVSSLEAKIKGKTCEGKPYEVTRKFTLYLRKNGEDYGTSLGMTVERLECGDWQDIDVRYERTSGIKKLATRYIENNLSNPAEIVFA